MRYLIFALALAACAPTQQPQARLVEPVRTGTLSYICSVEGYEEMIYITREGEIMEPHFTGKRCAPNPA